MPIHGDERCLILAQMNFLDFISKKYVRIAANTCCCPNYDMLSFC